MRSPRSEAPALPVTAPGSARRAAGTNSLNGSGSPRGRRRTAFRSDTTHDGRRKGEDRRGDRRRIRPTANRQVRQSTTICPAPRSSDLEVASGNPKSIGSTQRPDAKERPALLTPKQVCHDFLGFPEGGELHESTISKCLRFQG